MLQLGPCLLMRLLLTVLPGSAGGLGFYFFFHETLCKSSGRQGQERGKLPY